MYLEARIFGIFCYLFALLIAILMILPKKRSNKPILLGYLVVLSIIGYYFVPPEGFDLYRLIQYMHSYSRLNWRQILETMQTNSSPLVPVYYKFISLLGNDGFLAGITVFITFFACFSIIEKSHKKFLSSNTGVALSLFFIMASGVYGETIDGIRTMLAFSLIAYCVYTEMFENKGFILHLPIYLAAMLMHKAAIILVIIRVMYMLLQKEYKSRAKFKRILLVFVISSLGVMYLSNVIRQSIDTAKYYLQADSYSYVWEMITGFISIILLLRLISFTKPFVADETIEFKVTHKNYTNFIYLILMVSVICLPFDYSIFHRFTYFAVMMSPPLFAIVYRNRTTARKHFNEIVILVLVLLAITCLRGKICSIKFWI